jgi:ribosome-associated toxin RatA of RatAB toxin-antitoxin module
MRHVQLDASIPGVDPGTVFDNILRFERYPALAPHVQSVTVSQTVPSPTGVSAWELHFRSGLLRWSEQERFLRGERRLEFEQTQGDFDSFAGFWVFQPEGGEVRVHFQADFDFGIPSLEGILDPIAERVIRETVAWAVVGMFSQARIVDGRDVLPPASQEAR